VGQQGEAVPEEGACDDHNGGGAVSGGGVLGLGELDEHLGGGLEDLHLVKDGGAVVSDDDLARGRGDHFVHAPGTQAGADGFGDGACRHNIGLPDVLLALVVHVRLRLRGYPWERNSRGRHCMWRRSELSFENPNPNPREREREREIDRRTDRL